MFWHGFRTGLVNVKRRGNGLEEKRFQTAHWCSIADKPGICGGIGMELISIIVPIYNVEEYLEKCIRSALAQTYQNFELILVDDGSGDSSGTICDRYERENPRVRVIHKKNGGLSSARNAGIEAAKGFYLYFLDGDDYIEPQLLCRAVDSMEQEGADLCVFDFDKVSEGGRHSFKWRLTAGVYEIQDEETRLNFLVKDIFGFRLGWEVWSKLYKADIVRKQRISFESEREIFAEDLMFTFCYLLYCRKVTVLGECLYHYVVRKGSLMDSAREYEVMNRLNRLLYRADQELLKRECGFLEEHFYLLYASIMYRHWETMVREEGIKQVRRCIAGFQERSFAEEQMRACLAHQKEICQSCGIFGGRVCCNIFRYALGGNYEQYHCRQKWLDILLHIKNKMSRKDGDGIGG